MKTEYAGNGGCPQRDSAEHKEYAGAYSIDNREAEERDGADLLEKVLDRENLNRAFKKVKANKGAPGIDGMTVEDAPEWLKEHKGELLESIRNGNTRKGYRAVAGSGILTTTITNKRLAQAGYFDIARKYKSLHSL